MEKVKNDFGLILRLLASIAAGIGLGLWVVSLVEADPGSSLAGGITQAVGSITHICGQFIFFAVPLVIIGFISSAITRLGRNASRMLGATLTIAYLSSVGAALFAIIIGYTVLPLFTVPVDPEKLGAMPETLFIFNVPPLMPVMTALATAILLGFAALRSNAANVITLMQEFEKMVTFLVRRVIIPILPLFIAGTFFKMALSGSLTTQLPVFLKVILVALVCHFIWMTVLYLIGAIISKRNPWQVVRHYAPAYLTAVGTMSSAATLPVALSCARKSTVLSRNTVDFVIPMGATVHLCGSVLTETLFCMTIAFLLTGFMPGIGTMVLFALLLGIFAIGAPGVPGGTVMASLGIVVSVLGFDETGTGLLIAIFALQDSFGTACNVTSDGAVALMVDGIFNPDADNLQTGEA